MRVEVGSDLRTVSFMSLAHGDVCLWQGEACIKTVFHSNEAFSAVNLKTGYVYRIKGWELVQVYPNAECILEPKQP